MISSTNKVQKTNKNNVFGEWKRIKFGDEIPENAVKGGYEKNGEPLYIGRASDWKNYCGKISPSQGCFIPERGVEKRFTEFEILTNVKGVWVPVFDGNEGHPQNALKITDYDGEDVYSGRYYHQGSLVIGKVYKRKSYISYRGIEWNYSKNYEIFTIVPKHFTLKGQVHFRFFNLEGDYIIFKLKTEGIVNIILGTPEKSLLELCLSPNKVYLSDYGGKSVSKNVTNLMIEDDLSGFWIHLKNNILKFGKENEIQPLLSLETSCDLITLMKLSSTSRSVWAVPDYKDFTELRDEIELNYN